MNEALLASLPCTVGLYIELLPQRRLKRMLKVTIPSKEDRFILVFYFVSSFPDLNKVINSVNRRPSNTPIVNSKTYCIGLMFSFPGSLEKLLLVSSSNITIPNNLWYFAISFFSRYSISQKVNLKIVGCSKIMQVLAY